MLANDLREKDFCQQRDFSCIAIKSRMSNLQDVSSLRLSQENFVGLHGCCFHLFSRLLVELN